MNPSTTETSADHYYLYTFPDGRQFVLEIDPARTGAFTSYAVVEKPPLDGNLRYTDERLPDDWESAEEITEEKMRELTGYWYDGGDMIEQTLYQLERVRPDSRYYKGAQALYFFAGATLDCDGEPPRCTTQ